MFIPVHKICQSIHSKEWTQFLASNANIPADIGKHQQYITSDEQSEFPHLSKILKNKRKMKGNLWHEYPKL